MGDAMHDGNKKKRASPGKSLTSKDWVKTGLYTVEGKKNKPWKKPVIGFSLRYKTLPWPDVTPENVLAWQRSERIRLENKINKQFLLTNPKEVDGLIKEVCDSTDPDCVRFYDNSQGYLSSGVMHLVGKQKKKGDPDFMSGREQDGFLFKCRENNLVPCRYEWDAYRKGMKEREASGSSSMNDNLVDLMEGAHHNDEHRRAVQKRGGVQESQGPGVQAGGGSACRGGGSGCGAGAIGARSRRALAQTPVSLHQYSESRSCACPNATNRDNRERVPRRKSAS